MSTHNICFCGEIRKIIIWIPPLIGSYGYRLVNLLNIYLEYYVILACFLNCSGSHVLVSVSRK